MSSLKEYFHTDWGAMTVTDWIGLILTVITLLLMIGLYVYVFRPSNKDKLESRRHIPFEDDDRIDAEEDNDRQH